VNQFKEHQPDLILMDIKMPHMDGLEATRLIRSYSKEVPIVALTAFAFEPDKDRAIEAGCDDCLTKPVSQNALEKVLDKYVK
jgi:CheY-like chemotaxis protein